MSDITVVPTYDPANPYPVLNPNAEVYVLDPSKDSAPVPPYSEMTGPEVDPEPPARSEKAKETPKPFKKKFFDY